MELLNKHEQRRYHLVRGVVPECTQVALAVTAQVEPEILLEAELAAVGHLAFPANSQHQGVPHGGAVP